MSSIRGIKDVRADLESRKESFAKQLAIGANLTSFIDKSAVGSNQDINKKTITDLYMRLMSEAFEAGDLKTAGVAIRSLAKLHDIQ
jgi:hypothetical protein